MDRCVVVVNDDGATDDAQRARERQVAVGEEPPGGPDAPLPARDGQRAVLAGQVAELALEGDALVHAVVVHVVVGVDPVGVVVALGAETAAGPVEVVLAGKVGVHVPLVVLGVVLRETEMERYLVTLSLCEDWHTRLDGIKKSEAKLRDHSPRLKLAGCGFTQRTLASAPVTCLMSV